MKRILTILLFLIILGGLIGFYLYQNPTELVTSGKHDIQYNTINELLDQGKTDTDSVFNANHVGKKVQFHATVESVTSNESGSTIFVKSNSENTIITAAFDASLNKEVSEIKPSTEIDLLCICNGIAKPEDPDDLLSETSITFNRCSLINKN
jgi:hypothetical protein